MSTNFGNSYALEIVSGTNSGDRSGFRQMIKGVYHQLNKIYIQYFIAKVPVGYFLNPASNYLGEGSKLFWLTDNKGTGNWEQYVVIIQTGTHISSSHSNNNSDMTAGFIYISEINNKYPITWYVSYSDIYEVNASGVTNDLYWFDFSDNEGSGVDYYQITSNVNVPNTWIEVEKNGIIRYNPTNKGNYYIWCKDEVGNISYHNFIY